LDEICIEWSDTKEIEKFQRCSAKGSLILKAKELVSGGLYNPDAFPILKVMPIASETLHPRPFLSPGDLLEIRTSKLHLINLVDDSNGYKVHKDSVSLISAII